jgi:plastocyanin
MPALPSLLTSTILLLASAGASAATLSVAVSGSDGAPLADAVVLVDSVGSKAAVKPMADVEISQTKRQFQPRVTLITTGTRVTFPNFDTVRHHVYSFSPIKTFELKLYAGVPNLPITFDKPGFGVLGCNIHDTMAAWVVVADTPYTARSGADGVARIDKLPAGAYTLRVWHAGLAADPVAQPLTVGAADLALNARLAVTAAP